MTTALSSMDPGNKNVFLTHYRQQQAILRSEIDNRQVIAQEEKDERQEKLHRIIQHLTSLNLRQSHGGSPSYGTPRSVGIHEISHAIPPLRLESVSQGMGPRTVSPRVDPSPRTAELLHYEERPLAAPFIRRVERLKWRESKTVLDVVSEEREERLLVEARETERRIMVDESIRTEFQLALYDMYDDGTEPSGIKKHLSAISSYGHEKHSKDTKHSKSPSKPQESRPTAGGEKKGDKDHKGEGKEKQEASFPTEMLATAAPFTVPASKFFEMMERKDRTILNAIGNLAGVATHFKSHPQHGCETRTLEDRRKKYGINQLPPAEEVTFFGLVMEKLADKMMIVLMVAAAVSLVLGLTVPDPHTGQVDYSTGWIEGGAILLSVAVVSLVGALNDYQKAKQFAALNAVNERKDVKVTRGGVDEHVDVSEVVVGDVIHVSAGDIISVDCIFIEGHELRIDESAATGESDAVEKGDRDPFLISGTLVMEGRGTCMAVGVGVNSFSGKLTMTAREETRQTPLQEKLGQMADQIGSLGTWAAVFTFVSLSLKELFYWWYEGRPFAVQHYLEFAIVSITIVVVAIPEGLPLAVTLALAYSMKNMMKDNCLVRVLAACETMGGATTICSDKTGTLTTNKMTVVQGWVADRTFVIPGCGIPMMPYHSKQGEDFRIYDLSHEVSQILIQALSLNTTADEIKLATGETEFIGNKTELGLLDFVKNQMKGNVTAARRAIPSTNKIIYPFSSEKKRMSTLVMEENRLFMYTKGAPELLVENCDRIMTPEGQQVPLTENKRNHIRSIIADMASYGNRTIMVAYTELTNETRFPKEEPLNQELCCVAVLGIQDPIRLGVPEAVRKCQNAGIVVRMVTGDNKQTATSIAQKCGIYTEGSAGLVLEGREFRRLRDENPDYLRQILPRLQVLARSSPTDKYDLVKMLLDAGEVVAVTGDGTNDAPALNLADVGFAMKSGTEIARNAADMILLDDNFVSVVKAAMWGRNVNDCIKKFLQFQITVNVVGVLLTFIGAACSSSNHSPLSPVQLLWLNLIMDTLAALALATEEPSEEVLDRLPFGKESPLISTRMWVNIAFGGTFQLGVMLWLLNWGYEYLQIPEGSETHSTIVFNAFILMQVVNEFNARKLYSEINVFAGIRRSMGHIYVCVVMLVFQYIAVQHLGKFMGTTPLSFYHWSFSMAIALLMLPVGFLCRLIPVKTIDSVREERNKERLAKMRAKANWRKPINTQVVGKALAGVRWKEEDGAVSPTRESPTSNSPRDSSLSQLRNRGQSMHVVKIHKE